MHKNTLIVTAFLAVIAALLIGFNMGRTLNQTQVPAENISPTPPSSPTPILFYLSGSTCGTTYQYPNTMQSMESSTSGTILAHMSKPEESIIIVCQEAIPGVSLAPDQIETVTIRAATGSASISATLYHDASSNDGTPIDKLIFTHPETGLDVFIAGFGVTFNQFITTLKLQ